MVEIDEILNAVELEKVGNTDNADNNSRSLRFLYDQVEAHVRALQALGINSESLLMPLLMEKLPPNVRFIISRAIDQPE
ncbi:hypothetical protein pdam_00013438 [Pocillopora damicornis]|uniref:Uncharacterized protein n=1 Tax=Pocillopora damicornis TaxID=46731 RepID=A0A3M6UWR8_POCDA|nr:hypothetical protein pdam_00013438 [Pocillopora damicornis]